MDKETILFIVEGEKTERLILDNLHNNFFKDVRTNSNYVFLPFKADIYQLYQKIEKDEFETEIVDLLMERDAEAKIKIEEVGKNTISQIFLFFDYDGHANNAEDEKIKTLIEIFDNETNLGKIYISYPMVESLIDLKKNDDCNRRCKVPAKKNIHYKRLVKEDTEFANLSTLDVSDWNIIAGHNLKKSNCIVSSEYKLPIYDDYKDNITQAKIFEKQLEKHILMDSHVAVLASFPFFLIDFFGQDYLEELCASKNNSNSNPMICEKPQL